MKLFALLNFITFIVTKPVRRNVKLSIGGIEVEITQFPYMAYLDIKCYSPDKSIGKGCGASILNDEILLTSARCVDTCDHNHLKANITILVGHAKRTENKHFRNIHSYKIHEKYSSQGPNNDIALIKLNARLVFSEKVQRIALVRGWSFPTIAYITGWGRTEKSGVENSVKLKAVRQEVLTRDVCIQRLKHSIPEGSFCGIVIDRNDRPEKGDYGGPLVMDGFVQIGIASHKIENVNVKGVHVMYYTNITYHWDWIVTAARDIYCSYRPPPTLPTSMCFTDKKQIYEGDKKVILTVEITGKQAKLFVPDN